MAAELLKIRSNKRNDYRGRRMADYYENKFIHDLGEEFADPIGFNDMSNVNPPTIIANMELLCEKNKIPAVFSESSVEISHGFFRKNEYPAVKVSHPNPPQSYCDQLYVICYARVRFFFVGSSKAFSVVNNYRAAVNGTGGNWKAKLNAIAGLEPDMKPYEAEMEWHEAVLSAFYSLME